MSMPEPPRGLKAIQGSLTGWLGSQGWALNLLNRLGQRALEKMKKEL
jgi:hypothetical protein